MRVCQIYAASEQNLLISLTSESWKIILKHSYVSTQRSSGPAAEDAVAAARPTSVHPEDAHGAPVPHRPHGAALQLVANVEGLHLRRGLFSYTGLPIWLVKL